MARSAEDCLADILDCVGAMQSYTRGGRNAFLRNAMARDAVVARIIQLGEAVKGAQAAGLDLEGSAPEVPWRQIAGMRDMLSHQYWRTDPGVLWNVVEKDLAPLAAAIAKLQRRRKR